MNKIYMLSVLAVVTLSACGSSDTHSLPPVTVNTSFVAVSAPAVLGSSINFSQIALNTTQNANDLISCNGSYGNVGAVNGVASGMVRVLGTPYKGTIQFGNAAYQGATDSRCRDISKEAYTYETEDGGETMTICLLNPAYPYCTIYRFSIPAVPGPSGL